LTKEERVAAVMVDEVLTFATKATLYNDRTRAVARDLLATTLLEDQGMDPRVREFIEYAIKLLRSQ